MPVSPEQVFLTFGKDAHEEAFVRSDGFHPDIVVTHREAGPPDNRGGSAFIRLTHDKLGSGCNIVSNCPFRYFEFPAKQIGPAPVIDNGRDAGATDGNTAAPEAHRVRAAVGNYNPYPCP